MEGIICYIGIGSNLGDPLQQLQAVRCKTVLYFGNYGTRKDFVFL